MSQYAELCITTNFTFLKGASHPEELVLRAAELGLRALAITDRNSLAGVVRAWSALKTLREEASEALKIRSGSQVDTCSRQEIASQSLPHPVLGALPKLITGAGSSCAIARSNGWRCRWTSPPGTACRSC